MSNSQVIRSAACCAIELGYCSRSRRQVKAAPASSACQAPARDRLLGPERGMSVAVKAFSCRVL
jgi:hypothetical protein